MTRPPLASLAITVIIEITAPLVSCRFRYDLVIDQAVRYKVLHSFVLEIKFHIWLQQASNEAWDNEEQQTSTLHLQ